MRCCSSRNEDVRQLNKERGKFGANSYLEMIAPDVLEFRSVMNLDRLLLLLLVFAVFLALLARSRASRRKRFNQLHILDCVNCIPQTVGCDTATRAERRIAESRRTEGLSRSHRGRLQSDCTNRSRRSRHELRSRLRFLEDSFRLLRRRGWNDGRF